MEHQHRNRIGLFGEESNKMDAECGTLVIEIMDEVRNRVDMVFDVSPTCRVSHRHSSGGSDSLTS